MLRDLLRVIVEAAGLFLAYHRIQVGVRRRKAAKETARLRRELSDLAESQRATRDTAVTQDVQRERGVGNVRLGGRRFTQETGE